MPNIYLSPSTAEQQLVATGGNEEFYMNAVADAMVPYLRANEIDFDRNNPDMTAEEIIEQSNSKYHDMHLMLNMESGAGNLAGLIRGLEAVNYTGSPGGTQASAIFAKNLKTIYPDPNFVTATSDRLNRELRETDAVALMTVLGYRDNLTDVTWLQNNINNVARNLVISLTEYLGIPFVDIPSPPATPSVPASKTSSGQSFAYISKFKEKEENACPVSI